jgi:UDP-N-acetylglucosamine 2-epimerase (non-hydrolysing)
MVNEAVKKLIITDSGGVQEEAPSLGKPLVMKENNRKTRSGYCGHSVLVGTDTENFQRK